VVEPYGEASGLEQQVAREMAIRQAMIAERDRQVSELQQQLAAHQQAAAERQEEYEEWAEGSEEARDEGPEPTLPSSSSLLPKLTASDCTVSRNVVKCPRFEPGTHGGKLHALSEWITLLRNYVRSAFVRPELAGGLVTMLIAHVGAAFREFTNTRLQDRHAVTIQPVPFNELQAHAFNQLEPAIMAALPIDVVHYANMEGTKNQRETRLIDALFRLWQNIMPSNARELDSAKEQLEKKQYINTSGANKHFYEFEIALARLESLGVYLPDDSYSSLNTALLAKFEHGYNADFMHSYRNWTATDEEPVRITRAYFMRHFSFVKALVSRHYSRPTGTSSEGARLRANAAGGGKKGKEKGGQKGGQPVAQGATKQCHRCTDKAPHKADDCPHVGFGKNLQCKICGRDSHDSAACWQKHPELDKGRDKRQKKGKGKGAEKKKQGKGVAPAGGAAAPTK
jgi:hypothetical protein